MREIIIQQNEFLEEANIVPVFSIIVPNRKEVEDILSDLVYFTGM